MVPRSALVSSPVSTATARYAATTAATSMSTMGRPSQGRREPTAIAIPKASPVRTRVFAGAKRRALRYTATPPAMAAKESASDVAVAVRTKSPASKFA